MLQSTYFFHWDPLENSKMTNLFLSAQLEHHPLVYLLTLHLVSVEVNLQLVTEHGSIYSITEVVHLQKPPHEPNCKHH